jgi:transcriptional regulator with XRE-family HTH domain
MQLIAFGKVVRRARASAGLSQAQLGERSGVSQSTISRLERGHVPHLTLITVLGLASALGRALPVGLCPHPHDCLWQPSGEGLLELAAAEIAEVLAAEEERRRSAW